MPILCIAKDDILLQELEVDKELLTIGRGPENDVRLGDLTVSRRHSRLRRDANGRYYIEDVKSTNGTRLNGHPITQLVRLTDGDQLRIGVYQITFLDPVEINQLRRTHGGTLSEKPSFTAANARSRHESPPESGQPLDAALEDGSAAKPTRPLPRKNGSSSNEMAEAVAHPLKIGILINEASNAIFAIDRDKVTLGNEGAVDIRVPGPQRIHATIARRGEVFYVCSDTLSPCVSVNGRSVMNCQLIFNDRIEIGGRRFIFREI